MSRLTRDAIKQAEIKKNTLKKYYADMFRMLFHNSIKVENLPIDLPKRYLLRVLYEQGAIAYDKATRLFLPFNAVGVNQYGLPTNYNLVKYNGGVLLRDAEQVVILRMNDINLSIKSLIDVVVDKLVDIDMTIDQNLDAVKTMTFVEVDNPATLMSLDNFNTARKIGASVVFVNKGAGTKLGDAIKSTNTGATYLVDKLHEDRKHILNEGLSILGTATANTEKRERVQGIEVLASQNFSLDMINTGIDTFNYDAEVGGLDIRFKGNTALIRLNEMQINNMETGKGEDNGKEV